GNPMFNQAVNGIAGTTTTIWIPNNGTISGQLTGAGTFIVASAAKTFSLQNGNNSGFAGTIALSSNSNIRFTVLGAGSPLAVFDAGVNSGSIQNRTNGGTISMGGLFGGANTSLVGSQNSSNSGTVIYEIGGVSAVNSAFSGTIANGNAATRAVG